MVIFELKRDSPLPLYAQIVAQMREMIERGALRPGDRLPANRELARTLGVNRNTIIAAYDELAADGLIYAQIGRGTFVSDVPATRVAAAPPDRVATFPMPWSSLLSEHPREVWLSELLDASQKKDSISLAYGLPQTELFPLDDLRRSLDRVLRREGQHCYNSVRAVVIRRCSNISPRRWRYRSSASSRMRS